MNRRLAVLLAMAMFVLVVDTSIMNVSISAVVRDLETTVSGVQSAIALEALVSAAFILIGSKVGDLIGRKRAYVLGLLGYAIGATAMTLAQDLLAIVVFWAIIGGIGASLLLPAMQSLIHGNFQGAAQKRVYALVGAAAAIAAAVGPLLGGFITTFLSWRIAFLLEVVIIGVVLSGIKLVHDVPYTGRREVDVVGALLSILGMGGVVLGILVWQEGGEYVLAILVSRRNRARWFCPLACPSQTARQSGADRSRSLPFQALSTGDLSADAAADRPRRGHDRLADLPADGAWSTTRCRRACQSHHSRSACSPSPYLPEGRPGRGDQAPSSAWAFSCSLVGMGLLIPVVPRADSGWYLLGPLVIAGSGLGLLVSQLNNYTLAPISEERVSEAAGVNSAAGSFGLSFGLAFSGAIMLATLAFSFTNLAQESTVLPPSDKEQVAVALEEDAEVMSNTQLIELLEDEPPQIQAEVIRINDGGSAVGAPSGSARPDHRRPARAAQFVPDEPPA